MSSGAVPVGLRIVHRRYVSYAQAHYAGHLADGAFVLACFGDAATELSIRTDADEGLLAAYHDVQFIAPVRAGDVLEVTAELTAAGRRSRRVAFTAHVLCRGRADRGPTAAEVLVPPLLVATAVATVVAPAQVPARTAASGDDTP